MAKKSNLDIGASDWYERLISDDYGKLNITDTIDVDVTYETADITAIGANKNLNGGDLIYIYPAIISGVAVAPADATTLIFDVNYYKNKEYFLTKNVTVTFSTPADLDAVVTQIQAQLVTDGIDTKLEIVNANGKLRIQATNRRITVLVKGGTALTDLGLTVGDYAKPISFKVGKNVGSADTEIALAEYYSYDIEKFDTVESLANLNYSCMRSLGQSTGATFTSSLTADTYKGSSKMVLQTEYADGTASLSINDLIFNRENLDGLKGLRKRTVGRTFFSGKSADVEYKYGSYSNPTEFQLVGFKPKSDGIGLQHIEIDRAKSPSFTVMLGKEFRTSQEQIDILANTDRVVALIYEI